MRPSLNSQKELISAQYRIASNDFPPYYFLDHFDLPTRSGVFDRQSDFDMPSERAAQSGEITRKVHPRHTSASSDLVETSSAESRAETSRIMTVRVSTDDIAPA